MTKQEEEKFSMLFIRNGLVLDFNNNDFNIFTTNSIGESLCTKYGLSKGKSLSAYLNEASDSNRLKLISDLFKYYEAKMEYEYNKDYEDPLSFEEENPRFNESYSKLYLRCKDILSQYTGSSIAITKQAENLKAAFSSEYLTKQINLMLSMQEKNPTEAIGKSKELIESCCKTILDEMKIDWGRNDDVPKLTKKTIKALNLLPENVEATDQGASAVKALLGNLGSIPSMLAEIRNPFGSGHGKSATYKGLEVRHAKLAVGCSITFVDFIWNTYQINKIDY